MTGGTPSIMHGRPGDVTPPDGRPRGAGPGHAAGHQCPGGGGRVFRGPGYPGGGISGPGIRIRFWDDGAGRVRAGQSKCDFEFKCGEPGKDGDWLTCTKVCQGHNPPGLLDDVLRNFLSVHPMVVSVRKGSYCAMYMDKINYLQDIIRTMTVDGRAMPRKMEEEARNMLEGRVKESGL
ncbi:MAG: hypothetical protein MPL62_12745 [Alphaproteobacteria bacterium]|nr:hypothetical protein [Alphaproteobacteria bacterium]